MSTTTMNFDPTLHAATSRADMIAGAPVAVTEVPTGTPGAGVAGSGGQKEGANGALAVFEGFLSTAGHVAGVMLSEIVKYVVPLAQVAAVADPTAAPALAAFTTSLQLVQAAVVSAQQRWVAEGSAANTQKLSDVLVTVEQPIILLFAQAGLAVDTAYVTNLVNGVVAILNAQPGVVLQMTGK